MKVAKSQSSNEVRIWAVCLNTEDEVWRAYSIMVDTKEIQCKGPQTTGRNNAYEELTKVLLSRTSGVDDYDE